GGLLWCLGLIGSGIGWAARDRAARSAERTGRRARIAAQVDLILSEVEWLEKEQKWDEAFVTAKRAEAALATGEADPSIQDRMGQAITDLELVRRLEAIRAQSGTIWGDLMQEHYVPAAQDYAAAFREAGIDIDALA